MPTPAKGKTVQGEPDAMDSSTKSTKSTKRMYQPLKQECEEIRILVLDPARNLDDPLRGTLQHVKLQEANFSALSYVWGDEENDRSKISLKYDNGARGSLASKLRGKFTPSHVHEIGSSLARALRHMRRKYGTITLWTDFLCINQKDIKEKNWQIPLMKSIYSQAKEVRAWLGPRYDQDDDSTTVRNTKAAFEVSKTIWAISERLENSPNKVSEDNWLVACLGVATAQPSADPRQQFYVNFATSLRHAAISDPSIQRNLESIKTLSQNEYFARMWILQETGRARKLIFHYGLEQAPHRRILLALGLANSLHGLKNRIQTEVTPTRFDTRFQGCLSARTTCLHKISLREVLAAAYYSNPPSQQASNPKDYIYARLGLAENPSGIEVKYEETYSVAEVFTDASRFLLLAGFLDTLVTFRPYTFQRGILEDTFPSWAYDWSKKSPNHFYRYRAALDTSQSVTITPYRDERYKQALSMTGISIGNITKTQEKFSAIVSASGLSKGTVVYGDLRTAPEDMTAEREEITAHNIQYAYSLLKTNVCDEDMAGILSHRSLPFASFWCWWILWVASLVETIEEAEIQQPQQNSISINVSELLFRENLAVLESNVNMRYSGTKAGMMALIDYQRWSALSNSTSGEKDAKEIAVVQLAHLLFRSAWGMRPAVLDSGRIGYVPEDAEQGDKVVIFHGVKAPLVIRQYRDAYQIIGPAYICGVMQGEAMHYGLPAKSYRLV